MRFSQRLAELIALWTPSSLGNEAMRGEAREALCSERLINVVVGTPAAPFGPPAVSLEGWDGSEPSSRWNELVDAVLVVVDRGVRVEFAGTAMTGARLDGSGDLAVFERNRMPAEASGSVSLSGARPPLWAAEERGPVTAPRLSRLALLISISVSALTAGGLAVALLAQGRHASTSEVASAAGGSPSSAASMAATATSGAAQSPEAIAAAAATSVDTRAPAIAALRENVEPTKVSADPLTAPSDSAVAASSEASQAAPNDALAATSSSGAQLSGVHVATFGAAPAAATNVAPAVSPPSAGSSEERPASGTAPLTRPTDTP